MSVGPIIKQMNPKALIDEKFDVPDQVNKQPQANAQNQPITDFNAQQPHGYVPQQQQVPNQYQQSQPFEQGNLHYQNSMPMFNTNHQYFNQQTVVQPPFAPNVDQFGHGNYNGVQ